MEITLGTSNRRNGTQGVMYTDAGRADMPKGRKRYLSMSSSSRLKGQRRMLYEELLEARPLVRAVWRTLGPGGRPVGQGLVLFALRSTSCPSFALTYRGADLCRLHCPCSRSADFPVANGRS